MDYIAIGIAIASAVISIAALVKADGALDGLAHANERIRRNERIGRMQRKGER
jgi:hypothetical protein